MVKGFDAFVRFWNVKWLNKATIYSESLSNTLSHHKYIMSSAFGNQKIFHMA